MSLAVLSESDVRTLLLQLTKQDILDLQQSLADALHHYSTSTEEESDNGCCESYQSAGTTLRSKDGGVMTVTPASSNDGLGVKIATHLSDGVKAPRLSDTESITSSLGSVTISQNSTASTKSLETATSSRHLLPLASSSTQHGSLTLFDNSGKLRALLNTSEVTAFRTALASTMLFKKRRNVHDVVVFGAGRQAYWHIRLALLLRGEDIHHLNIINRDFERVHQLLETLYNPHEAPKAFNPDPQHIPAYRQTAPSQAEALHKPKIQILTPSHGEYTRYLHDTLRSSSCIFLCTPSATPLFPAAILTNPEGRKKGRYIAAIGSVSPSMIELHPDVVRQNVAPDHGHRHFHKHAQQGGAIVVDSVDRCLKEAGEVVQAGLGPEQVVEIGELVMLKRDAERRRMECMASKKMEDEGLDVGGVELGECEAAKKKRRSGKDKEKDKHHESEDKAHKSLIEWLVKGNVIYKSVGLGLMDVVVGGELVNLANARNIGTRIDNF
ncbi:hypothetical protein COCC4DRAFT_165037 [Bipolaris maydis ATCC 48331]|uniref:NAD(P)-binding protein n=2 Tax=Cochliobolus heterostrophus TaxID=5016 RepID=M2U462_COCH5|nr:uncharacterized protein COCC4DRAFT_165037 [Bipolaris maydis ATCC 48331]EMD93324.1 hypothetical protein COCHEDRAFT_1153922 [Bipolaris maydis C5]KAH7562277.1 hypothetical protein BM1_01797 [Bipolaris maydis]ENI07227.1 hypothetical protein COCC4DRAFT_165037 [Bipolaris maydis ATCC 48331]KAJ5027658.1 hypothetical protein J3E73DRAFT_36309 [Bipolaris maydis]KAJ5062412.1 hypothetical protein J3E74DRAFT_32565 [Bipolaris maydis]